MNPRITSVPPIRCEDSEGPNTRKPKGSPLSVAEFLIHLYKYYKQVRPIHHIYSSSVTCAR